MTKYEEISVKVKVLAQLFARLCLPYRRFICEVAYVISFIRTTYSRFTSIMIKRSSYCALLGDNKCEVELAVASARFSPSGSIILPVRVLYSKGRFNEHPKI
jgi:hypothetical protein